MKNKIIEIVVKKVASLDQADFRSNLMSLGDTRDGNKVYAAISELPAFSFEDIINFASYYKNEIQPIGDDESKDELERIFIEWNEKINK